MFTKWDQVEAWIKDNGFKRWILYKDSTKTEKIIDSGAFTVSDIADKLAMTEKYLRIAGGRAIANGFATNGVADPTVCEIRLEDEQGTSGISNMQPYDIGALRREMRDELRNEMKAQFELEALRKREADVERREKELDAERQSALGAIIHCFAPIGQQIIQNKMMRNVAGVDTEEPITVQPIHVQRPEQPEQQPTGTIDSPNEVEEAPFTDEETDEIFELMKQWKSVDPDYLALLQKIVSMAASGDSNYALAKKFI